jgi:hypothetical protein
MTRVGAFGRRDDFVVEVVVGAVGQPRCDRRRRFAQLLQLGIDQVPLQRRHDDEVDEHERAGHHEREAQGQAAADAPEGIHRSRKRYPTPRTVRMYSGSAGSRSSFSRRCRIWTSIVRGSR